jgi:hypothetical protein
LMSIRHLLHCNLCPLACPTFITSSLGGHSNSSFAKIVYTVITSTTTQSSWIGTVRSVVSSGWTRPSASSHWSPLHVIHRSQCVGSINMPIRSLCVRLSQRTFVANSAVPSIKPTSTDAQLLFNVAGEGLARLDIGDNTIWWQHHLCICMFCIRISATSSCLICSFIFSVSTDVSVFVLFLYISTC